VVNKIDEDWLSPKKLYPTISMTFVIARDKIAER